MFKWLHRQLNPHCPHCKEERESEKVCASCEVYKYEIERLRADNSLLMAKVLEKPEPIIERTTAPEPIAGKPRQIPWHLRRQMLEAESREKARLLANAPTPQSTEDLEKELNIAAETRAAEGQNSA